MATPQEMQAAISKAYAAAEKQLLPAKLKVTQENSNAVIAEITRAHGVGSPAIYKSETYYEAFKALYRTLDWAVPPAKLVAERQNERPATITTALESQKAWSAKVKAGEIADAKKKADAEAIKKIEAAINNYSPIDIRGLSFGKQATEQTRLRAYVKQELARNASPQSIFEQVEKEISRLYAADEKSGERIG